MRKQLKHNKRRVVPRISETPMPVPIELGESIIRPWYPGHPDLEIRKMTEFCMSDITKRINAKQEMGLTTGQYNAVYEAVEKIIAAVEEGK